MKNAAQLVIIMACLTGAAMFMTASGIGAQLGGSPNTGVEQEFENFEGDLEEFQSDNRGVGSIISLAISSVSLSFGLIEVGLSAPLVLNNMGVPMAMAVPLSLPVYALFVIMGVTILRGVGIL